MYLKKQIESTAELLKETKEALKESNDKVENAEQAKGDDIQIALDGINDQWTEVLKDKENE